MQSRWGSLGLLPLTLPNIASTPSRFATSINGARPTSRLRSVSRLALFCAWAAIFFSCLCSLSLYPRRGYGLPELFGHCRRHQPQYKEQFNHVLQGRAHSRQGGEREEEKRGRRRCGASVPRIPEICKNYGVSPKINKHPGHSDDWFNHRRQS